MAHQQRDDEGYDKSFPTHVVVDGVPAGVPASKVSKLRTVIGKTFVKQSGVSPKEIELPCKADGTTMGVCFVECATPEDTDKLVKQMQGHQFDAEHTFSLNRWDDFFLQDSLPPTFVPPQIDDSSDSQLGLQDWLMDPLGNDQFATLIDNYTEILTNNVGGERPTLRARRMDWTDKWICWSSRGTYFATVHGPGIVLWGGSEFAKIRRFPHNDVEWMEFSPSENYLVTYSSKDSAHSHVFWNVVTGERVKAFPREHGFQQFWWSHDDKYFARFNQKEKGLIAVYEAPSCKLLGGTSIKLSHDIASFKWSPSDNTIACYVPEVENNPARVVLMSIPDRRELNQKILYGVTDCKLHWHPDGDYLAVEVMISTSKGKKPYTSFELFLVREKGIPVDNLKIEDSCIGFAWEPRGKRFGLVHTEDVSSTTRYNVSFYTMEAKQVKLLVTLEKRQANELHWSPAGRVCVLAGLRSPNGVFEFYDVQEKETLAADLHHPMTTDVAWDPTGRYFVTYVSFWKERVENGYMMWSITGQKLHHEAKTKFCQFIWRPRPPTLLSKETQLNLEKNLKKLSEGYKKEDEIKKKELHDQKRQQKELLAKQFHAILRAKHQEWIEQAPKRRAMRNGYVSDDEDQWEEVERWVDLIVEEKVEVLP